MTIVIEEKIVKQKVCIDVLCDRCGESCKIDMGGEKAIFNFEYAELNARWGYGTRHDDDKISVQLCERCTYEIIGNIKEYRESHEIINNMGKYRDKQLNVKANTDLIKHLLERDMNE